MFPRELLGKIPIYPSNMLPGKGSLEGDPTHSPPTTHPHHCLDSQLPGFRLDVDMVQDTGLSEGTACLRLFQEGSARGMVPTANILG